MRVALTVAYDGRAYHGFQRQSSTSGELTIQAVLELALQNLYGRALQVVGSGRTDRGVHAFGQVVHVDLPSHIPAERLPYALFPYLPEDVMVVRAQAVPPDFHARYGARSKTYVYQVRLRPFLYPWEKGLAYATQASFDPMLIRQASQLLTGRHDFYAFQKQGSSAQTTVRTIDFLDFVESGDSWWFWIRGDGFLYRMVRIMIGVLLSIGRGELMLEMLHQVLSGTVRANFAAYALPPDGLYLYAVHYDTLTPFDPGPLPPRPAGYKLEA
ncbi:MAG: tRNA pseudouridine synthase A [Candidatus Carbobacillus altaicus]|uniref:tRNA pseudouridine synthase A n=1 Tax=Candidatus Carbonibacillus altaicus TaxID=2163959 RepID=A0A2R6Y2V1_9BACL|nr:MAG: tRNA pseudouridine synthase A [Candidatus Carbobacillus altaicus]